jgi:hypothetical protein
MTVRIGTVRRAHTSGAVRRIVGGCALAVIGAGLGAISINASGADLATGSPRSITGPSQAPRGEHRPTTAPPTGPTESKLDYLATHSWTVDQLYEELMRWTPPCAPASTNASMAGRC